MKRAKVFFCYPISKDSYAGWRKRADDIIEYLIQNENVDCKVVFLKSVPFLEGRVSLVLSYIVYLIKLFFIFIGNRKAVFFFPYNFFPNSLISVILSFLGCQCITRVSGNETKYVDTVNFKIRQMSFRLSRNVITLNAKQTEELIAMGVNARKISMLGNGVDTSLFTPASNERRASIKSKLNIKEGITIYITIGNVCPRKNSNLILKLFNDRCANDSLLFVIGPSQGNNENISSYTEEFFRLVENNNRIRHIENLSRESIIEYLQISDVFILLSQSEGMPNALLEAMSCGLAVIGSKVPGIFDIIEHNSVGFLLPLQGIDDSFSVAVTRLEQCPDEIQLLKLASRQRILSKFANGVINKMYSEVLLK